MMNQADRGQTGSRTVLLVEDNFDDVELTLRAFKSTGFAARVVTVRDGVQAIDYLLRRGPYADRTDPQPSLVLLDLKLPRLDGLEVLEQMRAYDRLRALPVIMLTSSRRERDVERAYSLGANSYICKPADFSEFVEIVRQIGQYWLELVELPPEHTGNEPPKGVAGSVSASG